MPRCRGGVRGSGTGQVQDHRPGGPKCPKPSPLAPLPGWSALARRLLPVISLSWARVCPWPTCSRRMRGSPRSAPSRSGRDTNFSVNCQQATPAPATTALPRHPQPGVVPTNEGPGLLRPMCPGLTPRPPQGKSGPPPSSALLLPWRFRGRHLLLKLTHANVLAHHSG